MILQELCRFYERLLKDPDIDICEPGFSPENISFRIVISKSGEFINLEDLREPDEKNVLRPRIIDVPKFDGKRTSGIKPNFLWDNSKYTVGVGKTKDEKEEIT